MPDLDHEKLAELLLGIAHMNRAIITGLAGGDPKAVAAVTKQLQISANISAPQTQPTFQDLPSRLMLQSMTPLQQQAQVKLDTWLKQELARLLA